ncbi:MAG: helix-turn-helix transcriptional regulator [Hyphomicrobiales bacterium]|nr:helix-turn-helix transcriptional regulator [Hyphomicrobiales bacterium]MCP5372320.1 helix-turn-helix transcriptional regulator [Hyphomicrobiales bacterium]
MSLGKRVRTLRKARGWTLSDVNRRSGLAISTISKMERGEISLTYDRFIRLARAMDLDVSDLFSPGAEPFTPGSAVATRADDVRRHETENYVYDMHAASLQRKHMTPMRGRIKAHDIAAFAAPIAHAGEEFVYLLEGELTVFLDGREPQVLRPGESLYFDSGTGHAYVSTGERDAEILVVCWQPEVPGPDGTPE